MRTSCEEFGHIHFQNMQKSGDVAVVEKAAAQTGDSDDGCHEGKSIFAYSTLPAEIFLSEAPQFKIIYSIVFVLKNNFATPYLERERKPPRSA